MGSPTITRLEFSDEPVADIPCPKRMLRLVRSLGSGLTRAPDGRLFAVGDRGPNLKVDLAVETYGLAAVAEHGVRKSAKVMPALEVGPAFAELSLDGDRIELVRTVPLRGHDGAALSGLPTPGSANSLVEPAVGLDGSPHSPDPGGLDSEGIAVATDGTIWIGDEYGPSLLQVEQDGRVRMRWVPQGAEASVAGAPYPCAAVLPAIAARRHVNRGFESLAVSADGRQLHLAFQSPLAHPSEEAHAAARHVRLWTLETSTGRLLKQYLYELDDPSSFRRDSAEGPVQLGDLKVSELDCIGDNRLLILERGSATTKFYVVELNDESALPAEHGDEAQRPTVEERSAAGQLGLPVLAKRLLLSTDDHPQISKDLEGVAVLDERTLLLVNDNDFGTEDAETVFWRVAFDRPIG